MAALVIAMSVTPVAGRVATGIGLVDKPGRRKMHVVPVPLLGGVAIYGAFIIALLLFSDRFNLPQLVGILIGASWVSFMGIWDDRRGVSPLFKLLGQGAAAGLLIFSGTQVLLFDFPLLDYFITIVWLVGITNALNLLDNMDGLSGGVAMVASAFFLLLAAMSGQYLVASLCAALMGACIGFLRHNFNPATIFMGDSGSLFLGFMLAAVGIRLRFPTNVTAITWMIPVLVLGLPIFDTLLVTISRLRRGLNPIMRPGRDHVSHRLVALGLSPREAVLVLLLVSGALGMGALFLTQVGLVEAYVVLAIVAVAAMAALILLEKNTPVGLGEAGTIPPLDKSALG